MVSAITAKAMTNRYMALVLVRGSQIKKPIVRRLSRARKRVVNENARDTFLEENELTIASFYANRRI